MTGPTIAVHEFEDADTGDELILNSDLTYEVIQTLVTPHPQHPSVEGSPLVVFTHRVRIQLEPITWDDYLKR